MGRYRKSIANWCMLGVRNNNEEARHGIAIGYNKSFGNRGMTIYNLKEPIKPGESFTDENVESEVFNLLFCSKESLDKMITQLTELRDNWDILSEEG